MIPFATWSISRNEHEAIEDGGCIPSLDQAFQEEIQAELTEMMGEIVENLMTASVVQLRTTLQQVGKHWIDQQTILQEQHITCEMKKIEESVMSAVADVMIPVLNDLQLRQVMMDFAETLHKILPEFGAQSLLVRAPENVHKVLNEVLAEKRIIAEIEASYDADVTVSGNQVVLVANLEAWSKKFREVVAQ